MIQPDVAAPLKKMPPEMHTWVEVEYEWISEFNIQDMGCVRALFSASIHDEGILGYPQELSDGEFTRFMSGLNKQIREGLTHVLVARSSRSIVGMVLLRRSEMPNCRHRAEICKAVIAPAFRGAGIVVVAFERLRQRAQELGIDCLTLDVREGSRAHLLWTALGFESFGVMDDYARYNGQSFRGHFMAMRLGAEPD
ncbi:MAG: GNAT family N-acetyltransferase [Aquabacterium sp.]|nr:MAG: GNAT family N-acetyltransferase [Aquabacterium sp.]